MLDAGGVRLVITYRPAATLPAKEPTRLIPNFCVDDLVGMEAWLVERETIWVRELDRTPWGAIGTVLDPDGNYVQILERRGRRA